MIRVTDNHAKRLSAIAPARVIPALADELEKRARVIAEDAAFSIIDGAVSGPGHIPSAPGQPPNADTHVLDQSIHVGDVIEMQNDVRTSVIADAPYAKALELGTSKMAERPFLRPATRRGRAPTLKGLAKRFNAIIRGRR